MTVIEHLSVVEDTHSLINSKHDLVEVIVLIISAIMACTGGWQDIQTYGVLNRICSRHIAHLKIALLITTPLLVF